MPSDPQLYHRFARVQNMVAGPATLIHPSVLARVVGYRVGGAVGDARHVRRGRGLIGGER